MPAKKQDQRDFQARIKQISNPRNKTYYDQELGMHIPKRVSKSDIKKAKAKDSAIGAFIISLIIGGGAMIFGEAMRVRYFGLPNWSDEGVYLQFLIAFWAMLTFSALLDRRKTSARIAQLIGLIAIAFAGHNLIHRYPGAMANIYGVEHVNYVQAVTEPVTIVAMGQTYGVREASILTHNVLGMELPESLRPEPELTTEAETPPAEAEAEDAEDSSDDSASDAQDDSAQTDS